MRITHLLRAGLAAIALPAVFSSHLTALSQPTQRVPCGERTAIMDHLADTYAEKLVAMGLDARGRVLEVTAAEGGTWTMFVTTPGGLTCLIASGIAWEEIKLPEGPST